MHLAQFGHHLVREELETVLRRVERHAAIGEHEQCVEIADEFAPFAILLDHLLRRTVVLRLDVGLLRFLHASALDEIRTDLIALIAPDVLEVIAGELVMVGHRDVMVA